MYAFCDYFHREKFANVPVSLVSELHNYSTRSASSNQVAIPSFRTYLRRFCTSNYRKFLLIGTIVCNSLRTKHREKCSESTFTLVPCCPIQMIPYLFYNLLSYFAIFPELFPELFFLIKDLKFLYLAFKGHNISLSRLALFFPSNIQCNSI